MNILWHHATSFCFIEAPVVILNLSSCSIVRIGADKKIDEYVPRVMPKNTSKLKLRIASPPNIISDKFVNSTTTTVSVVRDKVSLIL